jgi:hypothetical protein
MWKSLKQELFLNIWIKAKTNRPIMIVPTRVEAGVERIQGGDACVASA